MTSSIGQLKVYRAALDLERRVADQLRLLSEEQYFDWGDDLQRAVSGVCHYIKEAHQEYSYRLKIESLMNAKRCGDETAQLLSRLSPAQRRHALPELTSVTKQLWGLIKYLRLKQAEVQQVG